MIDLKTLLNDWSSLSALLDEALELEPGRRAAWVDGLAEAEPLKAALRQMLAGLDTPGTSPCDALPCLNGLPDGSDAPFGVLVPDMRIGSYRLLRELGQGGMGVVWLAQRDDGELQRQVALKLPRIDWSEGLHERLRRERDVLASLAHPHIAGIHDAGVDSQGRPYLALEYVDGEPIDRYCQRRQLPIARRLRLLLQVAEAVAHAHARLVVHRDLKPANILVTADEQARLLDFGIAQQLDDERAVASALTQRAGRPLTVDYASPEQLCGGPIGTASDVYSLAVVAYEVLSGNKPYRLKRQTQAALEEAIVALEVPLASTTVSDAAVRRALRGDLDAILNRAMKKDPRDRYPSVEAFAQDIERHLAKMPVQARPDSAWYRTLRFLARRALPVAAAGAVSLALVTGTAVALWQARAARLEAERAEQVKRFALSIVNGADMESGANNATTAVDLLQAARQRVEQELAGSPANAIELMTAVGTGLQSQGQVQDAAALLLTTRDRAVRELGPDHPLTLAATIAQGLSLVSIDRPKDAIAVLEPASRQAARLGQGQAQVEALVNLSTAQLAAAQGEAGVASARAAVAAVQAQGEGARPIDAFNAWGQLANARNATQGPGLADAARHAVDVARRIYGNRLTGNVMAIRLMMSRGLDAEGRHAQALSDLEALYADALRLFGADQPRVEPIAVYLGIARAETGDLDGAVVAFRAALNVSERVRGGTGGNQGIGRFLLGRTLAAQRRDKEALVELQRSVALLTASVGATTAQTARARSVLASVLTRLGRVDEADRVFADLEQARWTPLEKAQSDGRLALLRSRQGRHEEAVALAQASRQALAPHPSELVRADAAATLGRVLLASGQAGPAQSSLRTAADLYSARHTLPTPDRVDVDTALATAVRLGKP
ncbi:MAG TPA: protein kinase [Ideonella sp.]|uniref:protein kinase domain-containing protein n=1 Tax=Ideonella sp. TaxID=1929293 RepID=UPI002CBCC57F|nr:protein kinase [Ideonella sp.]HSI47269.1 protein kinase [Ideonella sp.]